MKEKNFALEWGNGSKVFTRWFETEDDAQKRLDALLRKAYKNGDKFTGTILRRDGHMVTTCHVW